MPSHTRLPLEDSNPIHRVGLIANSEKSSCRSAVRRAVQLIADGGRTLHTDATTATLAHLDVNTVHASVRQLARAVDLLLVFGGDGTMLRVARASAGSGAPMLGINIGRLGFLTAVTTPQLPQALDCLWRAAFSLEARRLIAASGTVQGSPLHLTALNDFVISRGVVSRMIELEVKVDQETLTRYRCDGLIVSSPTGSTAYSLAAGGPIVDPRAEVFALTPICPHALSNRSVIVPLHSSIRVKVISEKPGTILTADGQVQVELKAGTEIMVRRSRSNIRLVRLEGSSFSDTLRQKLGWSGSNV